MFEDRSYLPKEKRICRSCKCQLECDDIDYNFEGNQDEYWFCPQCGRYLFAKIRFGKVSFIINRKN